MPTLVLAKITHISQKKRVNLEIATVIERIYQNNGFTIIACNFLILKMMLQLSEHRDIHRRIIAAMSLYY